MRSNQSPRLLLWAYCATHSMHLNLGPKRSAHINEPRIYSNPLRIWMTMRDASPRFQCVFHQSCHICQSPQTNVSMAISLVAINLPHLCVEKHASAKCLFVCWVDFIDFSCDFDAVANEYIGRSAMSSVELCILSVSDPIYSTLKSYKRKSVLYLPQRIAARIIS